jgi:hypothetical protein
VTFRPYAAAYAALTRRQQAAAVADLDDPSIRARLAERVAAGRCAAGEHRQETDDVTGDEICRYCRIVIDDYSDSITWRPAVMVMKNGTEADGSKNPVQHTHGDPNDVPWWVPDPGAVYDVNPICGCHIRTRCPDCRCCRSCEGCYCHED